MATVLIVDDDSTMTSLLTTLLQLDGYEVLQASSKDGMLETLEDHKPDVVLMDVFIGDSDGLEILAELKGAGDSRLDMPVIMTSGMNLSQECEAAGASAFLMKPYDPERLLLVIEHQLDGD
jgi:two-component system nitrogen regulation response regulator NtrX